MPDANVIADTSESLRSYLERGMRELLDQQAFRAVLHDLKDDPPGPQTLSVCLYELMEDPTVRNRPRVQDSPDANGFQRLRKPPVALLLHYLLTPYVSTAAEQPQRTIQMMMGAVIKLLYDDPVLSGDDLFGVLDGTSESIKVTMSPLSLEDRTRIWASVNKPYQLSLAYEARVIRINSEGGPLHPLVKVRELRPRDAELEGAP